MYWFQFLLRTGQGRCVKVVKLRYNEREYERARYAGTVH